MSPDEQQVAELALLIVPIVCLFIALLAWFLARWRPRHPVGSLREQLDGGHGVDATTVAGRHAGRSVRLVSEDALEYQLATPSRARAVLTLQHALLLAGEDTAARASVRHLFSLEDVAVELRDGWLRIRRSASSFAHAPSSVRTTLALAEDMARLVETACVAHPLDGRPAWAVAGSAGAECLACRAPIAATDAAAALADCDGCGVVQHERCMVERGGCAVSTCPSHARPGFAPNLQGATLSNQYADWTRSMLERLGGYPAGTPTRFRVHGRWRGHRVALVRERGRITGTFTVRIAARRGSNRLELDAEQVRALANGAGAQAREASAAVRHLFDRLHVEKLVLQDGWLSVARPDDSTIALSWSSVEAVLDSLEELAPLFGRLEIRVATSGTGAAGAERVVKAVKAWEQGGQPLCPFCRDGLGADDVVTCETCETAHHRECLEEGGGCSVFGCASGRSREARPPERA